MFMTQSKRMYDLHNSIKCLMGAIEVYKGLKAELLSQGYNNDELRELNFLMQELFVAEKDLLNQLDRERYRLAKYML